MAWFCANPVFSVCGGCDPALLETGPRSSLRVFADYLRTVSVHYCSLKYRALMVSFTLSPLLADEAAGAQAGTQTGGAGAAGKPLWRLVELPTLEQVRSPSDSCVYNDCFCVLRVWYGVVFEPILHLGNIPSYVALLAAVILCWLLSRFRFALFD
jgi:hypothetical protein